MGRWQQVIRRGGASLRLRAADTTDVLLRRRAQLVPPRRLQGVVGDSDFYATGEEFRSHLHTWASLVSSDRVLDVGCGSGRIARVLADELRPPGSYDGFDINPRAIAWCQAHYDAAPARFTFQRVDIHNGLYNPGGTTRPQDFLFPYGDAAFDLVIATSVFTHLLGDAAERYLGEIARVLAPGGRLFSTWFLLGDADGAPREPALTFHHRDGPAVLSDPERPEAAVAYGADWLASRLRAHGLRPPQEVVWGTWSGRSGASFQDIVVASRS